MVASCWFCGRPEFWRGTPRGSSRILTCVAESRSTTGPKKDAARKTSSYRAMTLSRNKRKCGSYTRRSRIIRIGDRNHAITKDTSGRKKASGARDRMRRAASRGPCVYDAARHRSVVTVGGDSGNTRYSLLTQINAQNVAKLGAAWVSEKIAPPPRARAMPVIDNGLMIFTGPPFVYAVNVSTGQIAWKYRTAPGEGGLFGPGLARCRRRGGWRGPRVCRPFGFESDGASRRTGEFVWKVSLAAPSGEPTGRPSGAPLYADGLVSIGTTADYGYRGQIVGVDAKTGHEVWRFFVVPAPGDPGRRRGRRITTRGSTAVAPFGLSERRIPSWD